MTSLENRLLALGKYIMTSIPAWPARSAAAACGNAAQENLALPTTEGPKDHGSDGLWQWRLGRLEGKDAQGREGLKYWCARMGYDWTLMESQVLFMKYEMQNWYPSLWEQMIKGDPGHEVPDVLATLTANFQDMYEVPNPALANLDNRIAKARLTLSLIAPSVPPVQPPAPPPAPPPVDTDQFGNLVAALKVAQANYVAAKYGVEQAKKNMDASQAHLDQAAKDLDNAKQAVIAATNKMGNV